MELDHDKADGKKAELAELAIAYLTASGGIGAAPTVAYARSIVEACCVITPPEAPRLESFGLITMRAGGRDARSVKPGNVLLNIRSLVKTAGAGALTVAG